MIGEAVRRVAAVSSLHGRDRWATFDCYGTLIDWNGGIRGAARARLRRGAGRRAARPLPRARADARGRRHALLPRGADRGDARAWRAPEEEDALAQSLPAWQPFPEVPAALEAARGRGWKLAILSNTDRDYIDGLAGAARRAVRARDRRLRDRLVQAGARALATLREQSAACPTSTSRRASSTTSRPRNELGAALDLDQPPRRDAGATADARAARPDAARRHARGARVTASCARRRPTMRRRSSGCSTNTRSPRSASSS